jgi:hypothetical protein
MRQQSRPVLAALSAALCLAVLVGSASARRFMLTTNQRIAMAWPPEEQLDFSSPEVFSVECRALMTGFFHNPTFSKVSGALIGNILGPSKLGACTPRPGERWGEVWVLNGVEVLEGTVVPSTTPWHLRYDSFSGALPRITGVRVQLIRASVLIQGAFGIRCLYESTAERPLYLILELNAANEIERVRADETQPIPLKSGAFCPASGTVKRRGVFYVAATSEVVRINLVM